MYKVCKTDVYKRQTSHLNAVLFSLLRHIRRPSIVVGGQDLVHQRVKTIRRKKTKTSEVQALTRWRQTERDRDRAIRGM